ncbi:MAG: hypothetical protein ABSC94_12375 [Polyangiaceae bacterium]
MGARALILAIGLAGCTRTLPHPGYVPQPPSALVEVTSPPPPGRIENVPSRPTRSAVWVDGEWTWRRERWAWLPGGWVEAPPGAKFSRWAFVRGDDGRMWTASGTWRDPLGATVAAPAPLARARVESTQVVNASGVPEATGPILTTGPTTVQHEKGP